MGKVKSAIITALVIVAIVVLSVFATVSYPFASSVKRYNSFITSVHLGSDLTGDAYVMLYPEGVISSEEYNAEYNGKESNDKNDYAAKYTVNGGVYVEKEELASVGEQQFKQNVAADAEILSKRFSNRGYTSYSVSVIDEYAIKVSVPTNFTYAAYKNNNSEIRSAELSEITSTISYLTMSGKLSLRNTVVGTASDKSVYGNLSLFGINEDINSYFKKVTDYGIGQSYAVKFNLTKEGKEQIAEQTSAVASSDDTNILFYVGANQVLTLTCDGVLDSNYFYISVSNKAQALDYSVLFDSVTSGDALTFEYEYDEVKVATSAMGENSALFVAIAVAVLLVAAIVFSLIRYKKLGFVNALMILAYALTMIIALNVTGVTVTAAGIICAIVGLALLCGTNVCVFEEVRNQTKTGKTMPSSVKMGYKKTLAGILDMHIVILILSTLLAIIGVGEIGACGLILMFATLASYVLYWFTRFMWYVTSSPAKDKFAFAGFKREVYEDD